MHKIAMIADTALLPPVALSGVRVFDGSGPEKVSAAISEMEIDGGYKMVFITEETAEANSERISAAAGLNIVVIPGHGSGGGFFRSVLDDLTMKATGAE